MSATLSRAPAKHLLRVDRAFREDQLDELLACDEANATMVVRSGVLATGATAIDAAQELPDARHE